MEDVLEVYTRPYDPQRPQVCMDELCKQLVAETRAPLPVAPGQPACYDYEYERCGVCNLFLFFEPLRGWRQVRVTAQRTRTDWAEAIRVLLDEVYPAAEKIVLVMDNLNTHSPGSLYEAFPPAEAHRLTQRLEIHYTPKHGSWLNMAESELSILVRQCLDRRIDAAADVQAEALAGERTRNAAGAKMTWRFTGDDARIKLRRLYPSLQS